jgi:hypothetical protein
MSFGRQGHGGGAGVQLDDVDIRSLGGKKSANGLKTHLFGLRNRQKADLRSQ